MQKRCVRFVVTCALVIGAGCNGEETMVDREPNSSAMDRRTQRLIGLWCEDTDHSNKLMSELLLMQNKEGAPSNFSARLKSGTVSSGAWSMMYAAAAPDGGTIGEITFYDGSDAEYQYNTVDAERLILTTNDETVTAWAAAPSAFGEDDEVFVRAPADGRCPQK